jgi:hypothetical protein
MLKPAPNDDGFNSLFFDSSGYWDPILNEDNELGCDGAYGV